MRRYQVFLGSAAAMLAVAGGMRLPLFISCGDPLLHGTTVTFDTPGVPDQTGLPALATHPTNILRRQPPG